MALATQCPFCQTTFRVAGDQLKLHEGLVRCGHCNEVFNGNTYLLSEHQSGGKWPSSPDAKVPAAPPPAPAITPAIARANAAAPNYGAPPPPVLPDADDMAEIEAAWDLDFPAASESYSAVATANETDRAGDKRPGLNDAAGADGDALMIQDDEAFDVATEGASTQYIDQDHSLDSPPLLRHRSHVAEGAEGRNEAGNEHPDRWARRIEPGFDPEPAAFDDRAEEHVSATEPEEDADNAFETDDAVAQPEFIRAAERREQRARALRILMIVGSILLVLIGLAQGVYLARNRIAIAVPTLKPLLSAACRPLHCNIGLQRQIDQLSIESNELQAAVPGQPALTLGLLLRNHSDVALVWPDIELTLNDDDEKALIRRVFTPADYLSDPAMASLGFAANSEQNVKLTFTLAQAVASGYRVYLFYP